MNMRSPGIWFVFIALALLSEGVSAAFQPCGAALAEEPGFTSMPDHSCHDETAGEGMPLPADAGPDCAQQCACPAGPNAFAGLTTALVDLTDANPGQVPAAQPLSPSFDELFRPPIHS